MDFTRYFERLLNYLIVAVISIVMIAFIGGCLIGTAHGQGYPNQGYRGYSNHGYHRYEHDTVLFQFITPPTTPYPVAISPAALPPAGLSPADRAAIAAEVVRQLRSQSGSPQVPQPPVSPENGTQPPAAQPASQAQGAATNGANNAALTYQAAAILAVNCMQCHSSPGRGKVDLFDANGAFGPNVSKRAIFESVKDDSMPRTPKKLSAADKAILEQWSKQ